MPPDKDEKGLMKNLAFELSLKIGEEGKIKTQERQIFY